MRLICPNCGAQYEVPDGVIPEQGRDVQCSSCAHTWFQAHPDHDAELADELGQERPSEPETVAEYEEELPQEAPFEEQAPAEDEPAAPARRELDPSIAELLREEAEFETQQRAAESGSLETQPELGLEEPAPDEAARRALEARRRMASRKGVDETLVETPTQTEETLEDETASRRDLLPDIEEINSSLNADSRRPARADDHVPGMTVSGAQRSGGFRGGFLLGILLIGLLWALYAFSGQLAAQVPQIAGPLEKYTQTVDKGRLWLDTQTKALLIKLDSMAAASEK